MALGSRDLVMIGTKKGAFVLESRNGRRSWKTAGPHFKGIPVYHVTYDPRNKLMLAAVNSDFTGPRVALSHDFGRSWKDGKRPPRFPKGSDWTAKRVWHIEPGVEEEPDTIYCGLEPASLFESKDMGTSWTLNKALFDQDTRPEWQPGLGGLCLHSVLVDPRDSDTIVVAISSVGILKTTDGGRSWAFRNKNLLADFAPVKYPEYGQCPHHLVRHPSRPDVIYQQNHCGVYRSDDNGETWIDVVNNLPSRFGFAISVDSGDPKRIFVVPEESGAARLPPDDRFLVWTSKDEGRKWRASAFGLPKRSYYTVYREGMDTDNEDPCGVYVGTSTGQLFFSTDSGQRWDLIADGLPPILSVKVARA